MSFRQRMESGAENPWDMVPAAEVVVPDTGRMRSRSRAAGFTKALGNFESGRFDVEITLYAQDPDLPVIQDALRDAVQSVARYGRDCLGSDAAVLAAITWPYLVTRVDFLLKMGLTMNVGEYQFRKCDFAEFNPSSPLTFMDDVLAAFMRINNRLAAEVEQVRLAPHNEVTF